MIPGMVLSPPPATNAPTDREAVLGVLMPLIDEDVAGPINNHPAGILLPPLGRTVIAEKGRALASADLAVVLDGFSRGMLSSWLLITIEAAFSVETLEGALAHHDKLDNFRALTARHPIELTSPGCPSAWQRNLGGQTTGDNFSQFP